MTARRMDRQRPVKHSRNWADRMSDFEEEHMDYSKVVQFSDSEAEDQPAGKLVEVSEKTRTFFNENLRVPN